jgi:hypothetical protein
MVVITSTFLTLTMDYVENWVEIKQNEFIIGEGDTGIIITGDPQKILLGQKPFWGLNRFEGIPAIVNTNSSSVKAEGNYWGQTIHTPSIRQMIVGLVDFDPIAFEGSIQSDAVCSTSVYLTGDLLLKDYTAPLAT